MKPITCRYGGPIMLNLCEQGWIITRIEGKSASMRAPSTARVTSNLAIFQPTAEGTMKRKEQRPTILTISGPVPALIQKPRRIVPPGINGRGMFSGYKFVVDSGRVSLGR